MVSHKFVWNDKRNVGPVAIYCDSVFIVDIFVWKDMRKEIVCWIEKNRWQLLRGFYLLRVMKEFIRNKLQKYLKLK
ncbi:hypothetical protein BLX05_04345 [Bacillus pseudomycoides]|nr:hypothetical protein BLX05_04345 [Bacillus pseudomycoides]